MVALGAPETIEPTLRAADGPARRLDRRLSSRRIAATRASTATCCGQWPKPTANGARRRARACRGHRKLAGADPDRTGAELPRPAQGGVDGQGHGAGHAGPGEGGAAITKRTPAASPILIGELLQIQNGARLAARHGRRPARRPGLRRALIRAPSAAPGVADFDDLIALDPAAARTAGNGRMGALQARPAHRPYPGRRGAGHQRRPMGDRRRARRRIFQRLERGRAALRTLFMVGDFKQAIYGFQGTDPREFEQMRGDCPRPSGGAERRGRFVHVPSGARREFRDLSIDASFRSAQPVLDVVDAVICEVGYQAMGLAEPPIRAPRASRTIAPAKSSCGKPFAVEDVERRAKEGEEGWLEPARSAICRATRRRRCGLARRGAGAGLDRATAEPGRHPRCWCAAAASLPR